MPDTRKRKQVAWHLHLVVLAEEGVDHLSVQDDVESALSEAFEDPAFVRVQYEVVSVEALAT